MEKSLVFVEGNLFFLWGKSFLLLRKSFLSFSSVGRSLPRLPTKLKTGTRIGPFGDSWTGKVSVGLESQKYLVGHLRKKTYDSRKKTYEIAQWKKVILSQGPKLSTSSDKVEHWDLDMAFQILLDR